MHYSFDTVNELNSNIDTEEERRLPARGLRRLL